MFISITIDVNNSFKLEITGVNLKKIADNKSKINLNKTLGTQEKVV